ncbi:hypothetical protein NEUTE1DRAFT_34410, partial [Neurospora tetrasperma FGSC 2508]
TCRWRAAQLISAAKVGRIRKKRCRLLADVNLAPRGNVSLALVTQSETTDEASFTYLASKPPIGMKTFRTAQPHVIDKGLATGCPASKTGREGDGAVVPCLSTSGNAAATTTWVSSR